MNGESLVCAVGSDGVPMLGSNHLAVPSSEIGFARYHVDQACHRAETVPRVTVVSTVQRSQMSFHLRVVMSSDPRYLSIVRAAVGQIGMVYGLTEASCQGVTLAIDEAVANVIRHAYKNRHDREIELNCQAGADHLEFTLVDSGEPADPGRICAKPLDEVSLNGRGTHLIKATMDEMHYEKVPRGNQLRLIKHLPAAKVSVDGESSPP
jgi:serine/threonine-protein kinase RsbW